MSGFSVLHTCDDGAGALGDIAMRAALERHALDFVSVVPRQDMSGVGGALGPLVIPEGAIVRSGPRDIAIETTPVGCVRWALKGGVTLNGAARVVVGVNAGLNLVHDLPSSGTVMAALFAAARGRLAVAVSCDDGGPPSLACAAEIALRWLRDQPDQPPGLWSVNVPNAPIDEAVLVVRSADEERGCIARRRSTARRLGWTFDP